LEWLTDGEDRLLLICLACRIEWQTDYFFLEAETLDSEW